MARENLYQNFLPSPQISDHNNFTFILGTCLHFLPFLRFKCVDISSCIFFFLLTRSWIASCFLFLFSPSSDISASFFFNSIALLYFCHALPQVTNISLLTTMPLSLRSQTGREAFLPQGSLPTDSLQWPLYLMRSNVPPLLGHGSVSKQFSKFSLRLRHYLNCKFESNNGPNDHEKKNGVSKFHP